ncbi:RNA methyltransferase-like protein 1 [Plakobranchus ocellatus]|uniref:RNA methyltransferase-like protein 1 n=1 Tax=Plakobranchus ocellatus TaxID=259542 RepID=A0AAV4AR72_9GAST|nr:RNA methyltransferase-like protein 1 [Plakobranchus ocellatus]
MGALYPFVRGDHPEADIIPKFETDMHSNELSLKREHQGRAKHAATTSIPKMTTLNNVDCKFQFETLNEKDIAILKLGKLILGEKHQRNRKKSEIIILEGTRLIRDALKAGAEAECMCFCQPDVLNHLEEVQELLNKVKLYRVSPSTMKRFSDTVTPGGLLGVFRKPEQGEVVSPPKSLLPISLICDNLKDPGNAGTLLRTAAAVGCEFIFATEGCVNLWERKVLRSAMGAHFNIPIFTRVSWPQIGNYLGSETQILLANNYTALDIYMDTDQITQVLCAIQLFRISGEMPDQLNREKPLPTSRELTTGGDHGEDGMQRSDSENCYDVPLPVYNYSDTPLDLSEKGKLALVIGSEAAGLSPQAKQFASEHNGVYVTIPMNETTNSLNSAIAGSIILYELRKKLLAQT